MKIGLVAPVKPSHPYLENDPAPLFDLHYRRLAPWLWFRASDNAKAGGTDNVFPPMQGWSGSGCDLSSGKLPQSTCYSGVNVNLILRIWEDTLPGPRPEESVRSAISPGFRQFPVPPFPVKAPGRASTPILEAAEGIPAEVEDPHPVGGETAAPVE